MPKPTRHGPWKIWFRANISMYAHYLRAQRQGSGTVHNLMCETGLDGRIVAELKYAKVPPEHEAELATALLDWARGQDLIAEKAGFEVHLTDGKVRRLRGERGR
ncbi:MAG: hypothetical protein VX015_08210 [Planctomycetota bacterium]|nr:hypothetical protein [Planctomycetota bacterium]